MALPRVVSGSRDEGGPDIVEDDDAQLWNSLGSADYGDYLDIGQSEAEDSLESAQTFVDAVRKVMSELEKE